MNQTTRTNSTSLAPLKRPYELYCHSEKKLPFQKFELETLDEFQSYQQAVSIALHCNDININITAPAVNEDCTIWIRASSSRSVHLLTLSKQDLLSRKCFPDILSVVISCGCHFRLLVSDE